MNTLEYEYMIKEEDFNTPLLQKFLEYDIRNAHAV